MKLTIVFFIFFLFQGYLFAQKKDGIFLIDSLKSKLPQCNTDTQKVNILQQISKEYARVEQPDKGTEFGEQALNISKSMGWEEGIAKSYQSLGACYGVKKDYKKSTELLTESLKIFERLNNPLMQVKVLEDLAVFRTQEKKLDEAILYRFKAAQLCEQMNDKKYEASIYENIGYNYTQENNYPNALKYWQYAWKIREEVFDTIYCGKILSNIALLYRDYINPPDRKAALQYYLRALSLNKEVSDKKAEAMTLMNIEVVYTFLGDYSNALSFGMQALELEKGIDNNNMVVAMIHLLDIYSEMGDYPKAQDIGLSALPIAEKTGDSILVGTVLTDLSPVYAKMKYYTSALECLQRAAKIWQSLNDDRISETLGNIGVLYAETGDYRNALEFIQKGIAFDEKHGYEESKSQKLNELGDLYLKQSNYPVALHNFYLALQTHDRFNDKHGLSVTLESIGETYLKLAENTGLKSLPDSLRKLSSQSLVQKALLSLKRGVRLAGETHNADCLQNGYLLLSKAYTLEGKSREAFENYKLYIENRDSVFNVEKNKDFIKRRMTYEYEKKHLADSLKYVQEKKIAVINETNKTNIKMLGAAGLGVIALLAFAFYRKQEKDKLLIKIGDAKREAVNAQMSDHFISNVIDSINSFIECNDRDKAGEYLTTFHKLIRKVLENSTKKEISLKDELDVLVNYIELEKLRFYNNTLHYKIIIDPEVIPENSNIPPMIFQVLVENALKHGFDKTMGGNLEVKIVKREDKLECSIVDDGIGRKASEAGKDNDTIQRTSYGSTLAEKLIAGTNSGSLKSITITDKFDKDNKPAGTSVRFTLPYSTN